MRPSDVVYTIGGERYFTIKGFAWATMRSQVNVRFLMSRGNRIRKLKFVRIENKPYIPYSELTEFPFTLPGKDNPRVYHYTDEGVPLEEAPRGA